MNYLKTFDEISETYNKPRAGDKKRWSVRNSIVSGNKKVVHIKVNKSD